VGRANQDLFSGAKQSFPTPNSLFNKRDDCYDYTSQGNQTTISEDHWFAIVNRFTLAELKKRRRTRQQNSKFKLEDDNEIVQKASQSGKIKAFGGKVVRYADEPLEYSIPSGYIYKSSDEDELNSMDEYEDYVNDEESKEWENWISQDFEEPIMNLHHLLNGEKDEPATDFSRYSSKGDIKLVHSLLEQSMTNNGRSHGKKLKYPTHDDSLGLIAMQQKSVNSKKYQNPSGLERPRTSSYYDDVKSKIKEAVSKDRLQYARESHREKKSALSALAAEKLRKFEEKIPSTFAHGKFDERENDQYDLPSNIDADNIYERTNIHSQSNAQYHDSGEINELVTPIDFDSFIRGRLASNLLHIIAYISLLFYYCTLSYFVVYRKVSLSK
jgi:hypothetical protein